MIQESLRETTLHMDPYFDFRLTSFIEDSSMTFPCCYTPLSNRLEAVAYCALLRCKFQYNIHVLFGKSRLLLHVDIITSH